jgi:plastocyanin
MKITNSGGLIVYILVFILFIAGCTQAGTPTTTTRHPTTTNQPTTSIAPGTTTATGITTTTLLPATTQKPTTTIRTTTTKATTTSMASGASSRVVQVDIQSFAFKPKDLTVPSGTTVMWVNKDSVAHTIVSDNGLWESPALSQGDWYTNTFYDSGTINYHCSIHPSMKGSIIVE